jgi:hypothetical protein
MAKRSTSSRAPGKGASSRTPEPGARAAAKRARPSTRAPAAIGRAKAAMPSQTVGFRMPPGTASAIKAEARRRGTTISALLLEMWASYRQKR